MALTRTRGAAMIANSLRERRNMASLHDPQVRATIRARVAALTPGAARRWGKMTVDQMLWHVSEALHDAIDGGRSVPVKTALPPALLRVAVVNLPWPKGA